MSEPYDFGSDLFSMDSEGDPGQALQACRDLLERVIWENSTTINALKSSERRLRREAKERDRLEAELRMAQKLESIGRLAAGIAHEINTPAQFIGDNVRFLEDCFADLRSIFDDAAKLAEAADEGRSPAQQAKAFKERCAELEIEEVLEEAVLAIQQSQEGIARVSEIVLSMKEFSHPGGQKRGPVDVNRAVRTTVTVASNEWKHVADVQLNLDSAVPTIEGTRGEICQVLLNLIVNAAQAIGDEKQKGKGTIRISTAARGSGVEIRVQDDGGGIPQGVRDKLFEPFFTTKEVGQGSGQGLYIAHNVVVNKHAGQLDVETEVGVGTTFVIWLPTQQELDENPSPPGTVEPAPDLAQRAVRDLRSDHAALE